MPAAIGYKRDFRACDAFLPAQRLNQFINNPKGFVPGTAMGFAGIQKDSERADVIAYLNSLADNPAPLPTAAK